MASASVRASFTLLTTSSSGFIGVAPAFSMPASSVHAA